MIAPGNTLICVFSYNRGHTLQLCLESVRAMAPGFKTAVYDDASDDPETLRVIERSRPLLYADFTNPRPKDGRRHGNLYENIQAAMDFARARGFRYLFMLQDDMQFVRPLSEPVLQQYSEIFASDEKVIQVDPRFLRRGNYDIVVHNGAYRHGPETSYSDVGITHLDRLHDIDWRMLDSEQLNKKRLAELGRMRLFPFSPIVMHVPFPTLFRRGRQRLRLFPFNRGKYSFHAMTDAEIAAMDARPIERPPFFREHLRPKNMVLARLAYEIREDGKIFT
ncbi:hypothetical protein IZ6_07890 [Terrihabitans soli]|uniref:Uncharacterized protein n=1 Tax=Terrihabitans soli TaxID=708113 RepID=A0A6S6QIJ7_9HYPH|nr:glycosyltransferase [Terrihabitans soli]BCJ90054.1 hypothetical protein IZ6_07890 [Terrihabitans soli]